MDFFTTIGKKSIPKVFSKFSWLIKSFKVNKTTEFCPRETKTKYPELYKM